ncbi:hypothetical protein Aduo_008658 [Ancylostoma duodenale]
MHEQLKPRACARSCYIGTRLEGTANIHPTSPSLLGATVSAPCSARSGASLAEQTLGDRRICVSGIGELSGRYYIRTRPSSRIKIDAPGRSAGEEVSRCTLPLAEWDSSRVVVAPPKHTTPCRLKVHQLKEIFNLYDEELDGKIDGTQIGDVVRAAGLKPTNAMVTKASGQEFKRKGEKRITFEEWLPIFEQLSKEKEQGTYADFVEGLKVFDKEECGKILSAELRHILLALGERLTADEVDEILKGAEDAEGLIKYEDFIKKVLAGPFPDSD